MKEGDKVNYHNVIGGPVTSKDHEIEVIQNDIAWITGRGACVALEALSYCEDQKKEPNNEL